GDATWGAFDPGRARRGAVNVGEIEAEWAPAGPTLAFALAEAGPVPVAQGDEADCKVWLARLGPYLVVADNLRCGGANVSFRGVYRRGR
ncbi:MAG: hypothetical protein JO048_04870, partial [Methylobacteriaceae bacterium]|nr:hypothetical protein [Methylobacteriaceae bacterium]